MAEVVWTVEALDDLNAIGTFYKRTSPLYATSLVERLYQAVVVLENHTRLGRKVPEIDHDLIRELLIEQYRIIYRLTQDQVEIITIVHGRQDLIKKFRERK